MNIYDVDHGWSLTPTFIHRYRIPGLVEACSITDSLMLSTLECYYSDSNCLSILTNHSKQSYIYNVEHSHWFDVHPLVHNPKRSRFPPKTTVLSITNELMVERWDPSCHYDRFYSACAPQRCSYSTIDRPDTAEVFIESVSMLGGMIFLLRLITPQLVNLIFRCFSKTDGEQLPGRSRLYMSIAKMQPIVATCRGIVYGCHKRER